MGKKIKLYKRPIFWAIIIGIYLFVSFLFIARSISCGLGGKCYDIPFLDIILYPGIKIITFLSGVPFQSLIAGTTFEGSAPSLIEETTQYKKYSVSFNNVNPSNPLLSIPNGQYASADPDILPGESHIKSQDLQKGVFFKTTRFEAEGFYCIVDYASSNQRSGDLKINNVDSRCKTYNKDSGLLCDIKFDIVCIDPRTNQPFADARYILPSIKVDVPIYKIGYTEPSDNILPKEDNQIPKADSDLIVPEVKDTKILLWIGGVSLAILIIYFFNIFNIRKRLGG